MNQLFPIQSLVDNLPGIIQDAPGLLQQVIQLMFIGLFAVSIIGILWAFFKKANDDHYTSPKMISDLFFSVLLLVILIYFSTSWNGSMLNLP